MIQENLSQEKENDSRIVSVVYLSTQRIIPVEAPPEALIITTIHKTINCVSTIISIQYSPVLFVTIVVCSNDNYLHELTSIFSIKSIELVKTDFNNNISDIQDFLMKCVTQDLDTTIINALHVLQFTDNEEENNKYIYDLYTQIEYGNFFRYNTHGLIFDYAKNNSIYQQCFEFLLKYNEGLFNFYGRKINKMIQCTNHTILNKKINRQYIAEDDIKYYSTMLYCYTNNNIDTEINCRYKKFTQIEYMKQHLTLMKNSITQSLNLIGVANIITKQTIRRITHVLNGFAIHESCRHMKYGTQLLEYCLHITQYKLIFTNIYMGNELQAFRAGAFFKGINLDDKSIASTKYNGINDGYMNYIIMNKNLAPP